MNYTVDRKNRCLIQTLCALVAFFVPFCLQQATAALSGQEFPIEAVVEKVVDGDTVIIAGGERVRYLGINAPETMAREANHWVERPQMLGKKAKQYNQQLVKGKKISLEYDEKKRDGYHRLLAYVRVDDVFVNGELVRQGLALTDVRFPNLKYQRRFLAFQQEAKDHGRGLWGKIGEMVIPAKEALKYLGKLGVVQGTITSVNRGREKLYLNFGSDPEADFTCIIYNENLSNFPFNTKDPSTSFLNKSVRVYGCIKSRRGPVIIICAPSQIDMGKE